ncbi:type I-E CRISPR-associated protein Cse1/CasA [Nocardiopsis sediminis]|uniref:Type I-E CRISPR-associated protein Cse1/CasA n=1 Tax=Nocardiopsis sediminis TaxID=1778267 RepID=A0ABV8FPY7_9ACTN
MPSFNLLSSRWISAVTLDGKPDLLSLSDVLRNANDLRCVQGEAPIVTAALYRLLIAFLHRVHQGPASEEEWAELWANGVDAERLEAYEAAHWDEFWLLGGDRPFHQCPDLADVPWKPATHLVLYRAKGNNTTLHDHTTDDEWPAFPPDAAARWLVTLQTFDTGGTKTPCRPGGVKSSKAGPGNYFGTVLLEGETLWETLLLNTVVYDPGAGRPLATTTPQDRAIWEREQPPGPEPIAKAFPKGWVDLLTWPSRRILLHGEGEDRRVNVDGVVVAPGTELGVELHTVEAMAAFHKREDKKLTYDPVRLEILRGVWRHATDLLLPAQERGGRRRPQTIEEVAWLVQLGYLDERKTVTLRVFGQKLMPNPGAVEYWSEDALPIKLALLRVHDEWNLEQLFGRAVTLADAVGRELDRMVANYHEGLRSRFDARKYRSFLAERYWPRLDAEFALLLHDLSELVIRIEPEALDGWVEIRRLFERWGRYVGVTARAAVHTWIDDFPGGSPRQVLEAARAEMILVGALNKLSDAYQHEIRQFTGW